MPDFILIDGDQASFQPNFGAAVVGVRPGRLKAGGSAGLGGKKLCVAGDESGVAVPGCTYVTPQYAIPGSGTLKISALGGDQKARKTRDAGRPVLLRGGSFQARFEVQTPAQQPPPGPGSPIPDATPSYSGQGRFITANRGLLGG